MDKTTMHDSKKADAHKNLYRNRELSLKEKAILIRGKVHRFLAGHFRKSYVQRHLARRKGECSRCGACCQLLFRCAFAAECKEGVGCKIYKHRPINCRVFPLHPRDLSERDLVMPDKPCGYYFDSTPAPKRK